MNVEILVYTIMFIVSNGRIDTNTTCYNVPFLTNAPIISCISVRFQQ